MGGGLAEVINNHIDGYAATAEAMQQELRQILEYFAHDSERRLSELSGPPALGELAAVIDALQKGDFVGADRHGRRLARHVLLLVEVVVAEHRSVGRLAQVLADLADALDCEAAVLRVFVQEALSEVADRFPDAEGGELGGIEVCGLTARDAFNGVPLWKVPIKEFGWREWKPSWFTPRPGVISRRCRKASKPWPAKPSSRY